MNIFVLDKDPSLAAQYHSDQHLPKMILEGVQILCSAAARLGFSTPYKPTHESHPCTLWAGDSLHNWIWLSKLVLALEDERQFRDLTGSFEPHASVQVLKSWGRGVLKNPQQFPQEKRLPFAIAVSPPYKAALAKRPEAPHPTAVDSAAVYQYRLYYRHEKAMFGSKLASWTRRGKPCWWNRYGIVEVEDAE